jgi:hypothetical protein
MDCQNEKQTEDVLSDDELNNNTNEEEKEGTENWCKLNKTIKLQKLIQYATTYAFANNLDQSDIDNLISFFQVCLDKKKLYRVKDVVYNKETGVITNIPSLVYSKLQKKFTLKNTDTKRNSTLKALAPTKVASSS